MKSFLEYVAERLMGPSVSGSCWRCPFCHSDGPSLSVRPAKADYPIKFRCFRCNMWGDEFDLMKEFYPGDDYPRRRARLEAWRQDYERDNAPTAATTSSHRGESARHKIDLQRRIDAAFADLIEILNAPVPQWLEDDWAGLWLILKAAEIAQRNGIPPAALQEECAKFLLFLRESDARHFAECRDPNCDAFVCRRARKEVLHEMN